MGVSQATFFRRKKVYGGLMPSEVRKLRALEKEKRRLRKLVAGLTLDKEMLTEVKKNDRRTRSICSERASASRSVVHAGRYRRNDPRTTTDRLG
jgi:hypothetical protein